MPEDKKALTQDIRTRGKEQMKNTLNNPLRMSVSEQKKARRTKSRLMQKSRGESMNAFVVRAINETMERDNYASE